MNQDANGEAVTAVLIVRIGHCEYEVGKAKGSTARELTAGVARVLHRVAEEVDSGAREFEEGGEESTDWQAEYCRVHAELQGAYAEISALQRESAENRQAYERTFDRLRDIETGSEDPEFFDLSGDQPGN